MFPRIRTIIIFPSLIAGLYLPFFSAQAACCRCQEPGKAASNICIQTSQTSCADLPRTTTNADLQTSVCEDAGACKPVTQGGTCLQGPINESVYKNPANTPTVAPPSSAAPRLNIAIPGLQLSSPEEKNGFIQIPYLAQYIAAVYRFLVGISAVAAAIMIIWGGFKYIVASTGAGVKEGREAIKDALIGLVILLGAYTILQTINPETLTLSALRIPAIKPDPIFSYMGANQDAPKTMSDLNIQPRRQYNVTFSPQTISSKKAEVVGQFIEPPPSQVAFPTNLNIPLNCPGRSPDADTGNIHYGEKDTKRPQKQLAICFRGKCLEPETIKLFLEEQSRTGVPAGVLIAQMLTESQNKCIILNMFNDPRAACGGGPDVQNYNFGGVGCTQRDVPENACAHVAFVQGSKPGDVAMNIANKEILPISSCDDPDGPNPRFNNSKNLSPSCANICRNATQSTYTNCGDKCYPQPSHASAIVNGKEIWYPSVQCSRKYKNAQEFLDSHLGFVKACLPYNDSVYKFAYCVGASTYAGVTGSKAAMLAEIIERNCLCGSNDSTGCKRDLGLEGGLIKNAIQKRNINISTCLSKDAKGNCTKYDYKQPDYDEIVKALAATTKGSLQPRQFPMDDTLSSLENQAQ